MLSWLRKFEGARLAIAGLGVAAILFIAVNVLANTALRSSQVDLTEGKLYTVSDGTRRLLGSLQEPVHLRLYFSRTLGEVAPRFAAYDTRVRELLQRYVTLANGKLSLELLEPEPFSDAEDRAVADGLQGVPMNQAGELGYFGLAGSNSTDGHAVVPFFSAEREPFLEYDLTKLVLGLANPDRPVLGVISALPNEAPHGGMPRGAPPPLLIFDQIREFFAVEDMEPETTTIADKVKTLMVADLKGLSGDALRAVDRFVHAGGTALVFADTLVESGRGQPSPDAASPQDVEKLLGAWGIKLLDGKVAGDIDAARRVSTGERGVVGDYIAWLTLGRDNLDADDPVMANVERINLASSGILEPVEGSGLKVTPLMATGPRSMAVDVSELGFPPDVLALLRKFKPGNKPLILAARITGDAPRAFADAPAGDPAAGDGAAAPAAPAGTEPVGERKPIQVIVVADADMLYDRFWVQTSDFFGQRVDVPTASNADFVVNALENLADAEALIGLRGRGTSYRPFTLVEALRRDAEALYRAKEQELQQRLKDLQSQLQTIEQRGAGQGGPGGEVMLSAEDKATIERFRGEMLGVRKDLRDVQVALRSDIERLEERVKVINIGAVPLLICGVGGVLALFRRFRRTRASRPTRPQ